MGTGSPRKLQCFESSDGARLCYLDQSDDGPPALPVLVFIPGWTMPASLWRKQLDYFRERHPAIAFDPRGQGASAVPAAGCVLERRADDIAELLDRFPGRRFVLVGWSLAVLEVLTFVERHGEKRLAGLVLVDNSVGEGPDPSPQNQENPFFAELRQDRLVALRLFIRRMFSCPPGQDIEEEILASALKMSVEASIDLLSHGRKRSCWREILDRGTLPVLYLVTARWSEQARLLSGRHPRVESHVFENASHALFWDEAERFNRVLEEFLRTGNRR